MSHAYVHRHFEEEFHTFADVLQTPETNDRHARIIAEAARLKAGRRVLDVPCGYGRIASRLAAMGMDVTGIDQSPFLLDEARRRHPPNVPEPTWLHRDMSQLDDIGIFDAVIVWYSSHDYMESEPFAGWLRRVRNVLRPGGILVLEQNNPAYLATHYPRELQPGVSFSPDGHTRLANAFSVECPGGLFVDLLSFCPETSTRRHRMYFVFGDRMSVHDHEQRVRPVTELDAALRSAGFASTEYLNHDLTALRDEDSRIVVRATA